MYDLFFVASGIDTSPLALPLWLDLAAVAVGSFSGVLSAQKRHLDLVGMLALCFCCGLGGGIIRDAIMQVGNVYVLNSRWAIPVSIAAGIFGFAFPGIFHRFPRLFEWVDVLSLALFVATGTDKAIAYELHASACILMGLLTGVGGGAIRDVFLGEVPRIFKRGNLYALCAVAGSIAYYVCIVFLRLRRPWAAAASVVVTVGLRQLSLRYNILSPTSVDLTPGVSREARKVAHEVRHVRLYHHKRTKNGTNE